MQVEHEKCLEMNFYSNPQNEPILIYTQMWGGYKDIVLISLCCKLQNVSDSLFDNSSLKIDWLKLFYESWNNIALTYVVKEKKRGAKWRHSSIKRENVP